MSALASLTFIGALSLQHAIGGGAYPAWQECSYTDTRTAAKCGKQIRFTKDGKTQYRWLHPHNMTFGELSDRVIYMSDPGLQMTLRIAVGASGLVHSSNHSDFFPFPGGIRDPLEGWQTADLTEGIFNVNACPVTYADQTNECAGSKTPKQISLADYDCDAVVPMIVDTDLGVFMDDPIALVYAGAHPRLDLKMVITTSRNTSASARIAAKLVHELGLEGVVVAAGGTSTPDHEHLMTAWADQPARSWNGTTESWMSKVDDLIRHEASNNPHYAPAVASLVRSLRGEGKISPAQPLVYWGLGPAHSLKEVQAHLSVEDKACVYLVLMGGSIVPGTRLFFGPNSGFTPWAETNAKGDDFVEGGDDAEAYSNVVQDAGWAGVQIVGSEVACDSVPGAFGTKATWDAFKNSNATAAQLTMNLLNGWAEQIRSQCHRGTTELKCAPMEEGTFLSTHDWVHGPSQCDLTSIHPFMHPEHFFFEPKYVKVENATGANFVRGCMLQTTPPAGSKCLLMPTGYRNPGVAISARSNIASSDAFASRDHLLNTALELMGGLSEELMPAPCHATAPMSEAAMVPGGALTSLLLLVLVLMPE